MKLSPDVAQRDVGTSTVSPTGLPLLMGTGLPVNTPETAKREGRAERCVQQPGGAAYSEEGRAHHRFAPVGPLFHHRRPQTLTHPPNGTSFAMHDKGRDCYSRSF